MKLNLENTVAIGKRCAIYDAEGEEVKSCVEADTETGWIKRHKINPETGELIISHHGWIAIITERRPVPLRVEWLNKTD